jgi:hypothetical protein
VAYFGISRAEPLGSAIKVFVSEQFLDGAVAGLGGNLVPRKVGRWKFLLQSVARDVTGWQTM